MTLSPAATELSGSGVMRSRVVARDNAARVIKTEMLEGGKRLDGGGALSAEDQAAVATGYLDLLKMVEAYLVAHPAEYA
ncbi:hypothetical protein ZWY2020_020318 [Hordeum vulgare]|nr:hypothetical protein ZWY2020_020318 [Hordeum vulgare]